MYYSDSDIEKLYSEYELTRQKYEELLKAYALRQFSNSSAKEYATHGFMRRVRILNRCISNIYEICPPELNEKPSQDVLLDTTINLQAFILNIFGCIDNLAWVWAKEKSIENEEGSPLSGGKIGFFDKKKHKLLRNSLPSDFTNYIDTMHNWYEYLKSFRHALAHRIPLYIPPYTLNKEEAKREEELEKNKWETLRNKKFEEYEAINQELNSIGRFTPWMTHSYSENSGCVPFHSQILADWNTVVELSSKFIKII